MKWKHKLKLKVCNKVFCCILSIVVILVFVGCEDNSLEAQLERAKKQSNAAQEAYEHSKKNYDNMLDDFEDYQKSQDNFESLK